MEIHRDTTPSNIIDELFIKLDRTKDRNFNSQVRFYTDYTLMEGLAVDDINIILIGRMSRKIIFWVDKNRCGYFGWLRYLNLPWHFKLLRKYRKEIRRGLLREFAVKTARQEDLTESYQNYYLLFGLRALVKVLPQNVTHLKLPVKSYVRENENLKLHKFTKLTHLSIHGNIKLLTIPDSIDFVNLRDMMVVPNCLKNGNFQIINMGHEMLCYKTKSDVS